MSRVLIGPANYSGQAAAWAAALRAAGQDAVSFSFRPRPRLPGTRARGFGFPADVRLPFPKMTTPLGRRRRGRRLVEGCSRVLLDGFVPLLGSVRTPLVQGELDQLQSWGVRVALIAHGSDVRDPRQHTENYPESYFPLLDPSFREWLTHQSASNRALATHSGLPIFVSTPDLLLDVPHATWVPLSVDVERWTAPPRPRRTRPRVLHVPSSVMRGSEAIDPVLEDLHARGLIEYVRRRGVPHSEMPGLVATADVVVDQIRSGFYGVAAIEAMVSGAIVVGHLSAAMREFLPDESGIVDAVPQTFAETMSHLLDTQSEWPAMAARSNEYARRWHDGVESVRVLSRFTLAG